MDTTLPPRAGKPAPAMSERDAGARAERERCRQIAMSPAAAGREIAARIIALETDLSAEAGIRLLSSLALDSAPEAPAANGSWDAIVNDMNKGGRR